MLKISNLSFSYQNQQVLENVNLTFSTPEVVAIIGDNGAGKTTLLRLIAGELVPDMGTIKLQGEIGFLRQTQEDLNDKSGGEQTQIRLSEVLRNRPNVLLLDEPTNNLDAESRQWLLRNLQKYHGLVLLVSHDRDFINQIATKIIHIENGKMEIFAGNYADFYERQEQIRQQNILEYENAQREKRKLKKQLKVAQDRAHKSNRRAYDKITDESRLKYNGQRMAAQNSAGKILRATKSRIEQLSDMEKPFLRKSYAAHVSKKSVYDKKILELRKLEKSFGRKTLFRDLDFELWGGERVRIVGRNGSGKTTLFKIIMGEETADGGEVWLRPEIEIGYISQDVKGFDFEESFVSQNVDFDRAEIYHAAATMDFSPEEMNKPIEQLSRGQQTKMAILKLILRPLDLAILDELTNHLDIRARENIERALEKYQGAILVATHDEAFARKLGIEREIAL